MYINGSLVIIVLFVFVVIALFSFVFACDSITYCLKKRHDKNLYKNVMICILQILLLVSSCICFKNIIIDAKAYRANQNNVSYQIIKANNDKSIKVNGGRYRFSINSNNEFNYYYKTNDTINHKTIDFDFPIYEDTSDEAYINEASYNVEYHTQLLGFLDLKWGNDDNYYEYELHIPPGQFEKQEIILN